MESLNLMKVCKVASEFLHSELMEESRKFEASAATIMRNGVGASGGMASFAEMPKIREVNSVQANRADDDDSSYETVGYEEADADDESSYLTIESVHTVSSYEEIVKDEESSYETVEEIEEPSEYETEEEEIQVSDYVTDSDVSSKRKLVS